MNKIIVLICALAAVFFVNAGLSFNALAKELRRQKENILIQNDQMEAEISQRQRLDQRPPVAISKAFSLVINEIRYLESNSGTKMTLSIKKSSDNEDIADNYIDSQYWGIKKLPVMIRVDKFSDETDMGAVLDDIYQLGVESDFKATEINKDGNILIVKGDIYGV